MPFAAHITKVEISPDNITYTEVDGINDASFETSRDVLETTDFKDTSGAKTRIVGLQECSVSMSGDYEDTDTNGQNIIRSFFLAGTSLYVGFKFDGVDGYKSQFLVSSFSITPTVDGKVEFEAEFVSIAAVTTHA